MTKNRFPASRFAKRVLPALAVAAFASVVTVPAFAADAVVLYSADGLENLYKDVLPAFEKKEGVKVNIVTAGSGEVVNRATVEKDSPKADVLVTLPPFIQQASQAGPAAALPERQLQERAGDRQSAGRRMGDLREQLFLVRDQPGSHEDRAEDLRRSAASRTSAARSRIRIRPRRVTAWP